MRQVLPVSLDYPFLIALRFSLTFICLEDWKDGFTASQRLKEAEEESINNNCIENRMSRKAKLHV
jgi:hypothetical protein